MILNVSLETLEVIHLVLAYFIVTQIRVKFKNNMEMLVKNLFY